MSSHLSQRPLLRIRPATLSDLPSIASVWFLSFFDSPIIGDMMHPMRSAYPSDLLRWFRHGVRARYWDWTHRFVVVTAVASPDSTGEGESGAGAAPSCSNRNAVTSANTTVSSSHASEQIVGAADWHRLGTAASSAERRRRGMALAAWDPRRLIGLAVGYVNALEEWLWPNRAAKGAPGPEFLETAVEDSKRFYQGERAECWDLYVCGVHPEWQGKGVGKLLVQWGLEKARDEGVSASVMTGKECGEFYTKAGYREIISNGDSGIICFWDPK